MTELAPHSPQAQASAETLSSVTLASPSISEEVVGVSADSKNVGNPVDSDEDATKTSKDKSEGSEESNDKRPWFPRLSLWKRKQKERSEQKSFLRFFQGLKPKKTASSYSTLDEPLPGSASAANTLERKNNSKHGENLEEPLALEDRGSRWTRFDPRRFRRLSEFADFGRRKWRGLRRASSSVGVRIRRTLSRLAPTRSSTTTVNSATDGVKTVSQPVSDIGTTFSLSLDGVAGESYEIVTNSPLGLNINSDGNNPTECPCADCTDTYETNGPAEIGDPNRTPTPPMLAENSSSTDL